MKQNFILMKIGEWLNISKYLLLFIIALAGLFFVKDLLNKWKLGYFIENLNDGGTNKSVTISRRLNVYPEYHKKLCSYAFENKLHLMYYYNSSTKFSLRFYNYQFSKDSTISHLRDVECN